MKIQKKTSKFLMQQSEKDITENLYPHSVPPDGLLRRVVTLSAIIAKYESVITALENIQKVMGMLQAMLKDT